MYLIPNYTCKVPVYCTYTGMSLYIYIPDGNHSLKAIQRSNYSVMYASFWAVQIQDITVYVNTVKLLRLIHYLVMLIMGVRCIYRAMEGGMGLVLLTTCSYRTGGKKLHQHCMNWCHCELQMRISMLFIYKYFLNLPHVLGLLLIVLCSESIYSAWGSVSYIWHHST